MRKLAIATGLLFCCVNFSLAASKMEDATAKLQTATVNFVNTLDTAQRNQTVLAFDSPLRYDWHFYPKKERKGLELKHMTSQQREAADALLKAALSDVGYKKATQIMRFEDLVLELEKGSSSHQRAPDRYFYTVFGDPAKDSQWGLSIEGHHLSINITVRDGHIVAATPQSFGMNPATVRNENKTGVTVGTRVLEKEDALAFQLVNSLSDEQRAKAIISSTNPKDVRDVGKPRPASDAPAGIPYSELNGEQRSLLIQLIQEFNGNMLAPVAKARLDKLQYDGLNDIHFAWTGGTETTSPHTYTIQAPSLRIELNQVQSDPAGNPANHIHTVLRDLNNDFAVSGQ
ncbi:DUF3500 domain-containing protein [Planctomicrobium sp. SH664]|uniref:DUF3500 domain-containing protein n=1 Tax=Planctomicrobium sp. SH664 TaxID=3448125 RepID=UPI003F5CA8E0